MLPIHHITLPNGFQIIYEKSISSTPISSVQLFCNVGSVHTPPQVRGLTHMIEPMCFKGTRAHPNFDKITLDYTNIGAEFNAFSTQRFTNFVVKCQDIFLEKCIHYMSEEVLDSLFDIKKFKNEEQVVINENSNNNDVPRYVLNKQSTRLLYEGTPFEFIVDDLSYHEHLYDYETAVKFYKQHYVPSNMVLSISSNIPFSKIIQMIKRSIFSKRFKLTKPPTALCLSNTPRLGSKYEITSLPNTHTIYFNLSFQTCDQYNFKDKYTLVLLGILLCNSLSSRFFKLLRDKYGLVYGISANASFNEVGGDFTISTQCEPSHFLHKDKISVLPLIIKEFNHLLKNGVTQSELNVSKNYLRGHMLIDLENIDTQTNYNGLMCLLYEDPKIIIPYGELFDTYYKTITRTQVLSVMRKYFRLNRLCLSVVGDKIPPLSLIQSECNKLTK